MSDNNSTTWEDIKKGVSIISRKVRKHKWTLIGFSILGLASTIGSTAMPYLTGKIIDVIAGGNPVNVIGGLSFGLMGLLITYGIVQGTTNVVDWQLSIHTTRLGYEVQAEFIRNCMERLFRLPLSFHHDRKFGDISTRVHRARNGYRNLFSIVPDLLPPLASILLASIFVFSINTILALILVGGLLVFTFIFVWQVAPTARYMRNVNDVFSDLFGDAWDGLRNPRIIKSVQTETQEAKAVQKDFYQQALPAWMRMYTAWQRITITQKTVVLATHLGLFIAGAPLVQTGVLTIGELVAFNGYAGLVFNPFIRLSRLWQSLQNSLMDVVKSEEMLASTDPEDYSDTGSTPSLRDEIAFSDVCFQYNQDEGLVLKDMSFEVAGGSTTALVGESGEGKSTLVDLIPRFIEPTSGYISIGGINLQDINLRHLRSKIALVPQRITLFNRSIQANIAYGLDADKSETIAAAKQAQAHEFITDTYDGYDSVVGEEGLKLSAGQRQRIALAKALLSDPDILILDEPTSALDAKNERLITEVLEDLWQNRTTFIIAHRLSTVHNADNILVLKDGQIAESGTHEELIDREEEYKRLHDLQIGLHE